MQITTLNFVVPELEEIANLDRGIKGKTAVVYLNALAVQVMIGTAEKLELFKTIPRLDQKRLVQTIAMIRAADAARHDRENSADHYYHLRTHTYLLSEQVDVMSQEIHSLKEQCANLQIQVETAKDNLTKSLGELEHREDEYAKLVARFDETEAQGVETVERLEERIAATSLDLSKEKRQSMEWKAKDQEKYNQLTTQAKALSECELALADTQEQLKDRELLLGKNEQHCFKLEAELKATHSHSGSCFASNLLINSEAALKQEIEKQNKTLTGLHVRITELELKMSEEMAKVDELHLELKQTQDASIMVQGDVARYLEVVRIKEAEIENLEDQLYTSHQHSTNQQGPLLDLQLQLEAQEEAITFNELIVPICLLAVNNSRLQILLQNAQRKILEMHRNNHTAVNQLVVTISLRMFLTSNSFW
ncbi:hypothetical protein C8F04DRAFT_1177447 [Mycena alexandri]|uniref:Uncharacterized protein n=1 Tax=Mycena alexandri TaxID=1745969 RepID=A0AAD6TBB9_9AGAR|nr:hypothetical protein C8F04DRAFT_1177447 [Mycena alexandri]